MRCNFRFLDKYQNNYGYQPTNPTVDNLHSTSIYYDPTTQLFFIRMLGVMVVVVVFGNSKRKYIIGLIVLVLIAILLFNVNITTTIDNVNNVFFQLPQAFSAAPHLT
jgi:hypothetical protein